MKTLQLLSLVFLIALQTSCKQHPAPDQPGSQDENPDLVESIGEEEEYPSGFTPPTRDFDPPDEFSIDLDDIRNNYSPISKELSTVTSSDGLVQLDNTWLVEVLGDWGFRIDANFEETEEFRYNRAHYYHSYYETPYIFYFLFYAEDHYYTNNDLYLVTIDKTGSHVIFYRILGENIYNPWSHEKEWFWYYFQPPGSLAVYELEKYYEDGEWKTDSSVYSYPINENGDIGKSFEEEFVYS